LSGQIIADTGGLLRALARKANGKPSFPEYEDVLVDGTVAALTERRKVYRVLTTDRRDFSAIRVGPRLSQPLELFPLISGASLLRGAHAC